MGHGNDQVLADLARERGGDLTRYAYLLTGDVAASQDLVQDAFVKVFGRLRTGFTPQVAEAYVRRAILTLFIDGYRRGLTLTGVRHLLATGDDHDSTALAADRLDLQRALATLAPQLRACVVLRFYEDLTVPAIAEQMGLAQGTVKRYLSDAVHHLEELLGPISAPPEGEPADVLPAAAPVRRATKTVRS
ncbi:MAG: sigma-70 family RNA polymerase sigma factor [Cellulomonadaceae bacterium]|nr:sigma-70 family RNA polymerase sigma factor [Cellulomonadaceae bacterium]